MAIINQIKDLVIDSVNQALAKEGVDALNTTDIVSLGNEIGEANKYDVYFGALTNRIVKTRYFARAYQGKDRKVLRDETEYGAFVRQITVTVPEYSDNPAYNIDAETGKFTQLSPYAVQSTIEVDEKIYGGQGTFSIEFMYPINQIKTAFTSWSEMAALIDSIYVQLNNKMKKAEETLVSSAVNTAVANTANAGKNIVALVTEYNALHQDAQVTADDALENATFLEFAARRIYEITQYMQQLSVAWNPSEHETFTPEDKLVCEILTKFDSALVSILKANTFHDELIKLPNYENIPFWQGSGTGYAFADVSKIKVQNDAFATGQNPTGEVTVNNVVAVLRDSDACGAFFGDQRSWEQVNPRSDVVIHGEQYKKGFGVNPLANIVVFTLN